MANTLSLSSEHGPYLQGLHQNSLRGSSRITPTPPSPTLTPRKHHHGPTRSAVFSSLRSSEEKENVTAKPTDAVGWSSNAAAKDALDVFQSPAVPPPCHTTPDTPEFLARIEQALRIDDAGLATPLPCKTVPVRSASSSYPSAGHNTPRVQSPVSEHHPRNRLSFSGLSKFGRANDTLSNLQSSSPASAISTKDGAGDTSHDELVADTAAAITEWQDASQPLKTMVYNNYALTDSSELFPSDSLSQRDNVSLSPSTLPPATPPSHVPAAAAAAAAAAATATTTASATSEASSESFTRLNNLGHQYDGTREARRNGSPEVKYRPAPALDGATHPFHSSKRKASTFSLRSLTRSFTKRRRLVAIRHWASKVYHRSSRRLTEAYRRFKNHDHDQMPPTRVAGSWDSHAHGQAANPLDGSGDDKPRGSNAVIGFERRRRSEDWWKDGVSRYRAPSGMFAK
ncbi:hypothetical protein E4U41_006005 [Claviceps citrina]|nr:hypothetical protein E4U41_006005 [Claviceps citrina]